MDYRHVLVATPQFIKSFGKPESPHDLVKFPCASWSKKDNSAEWILGGEKILIKTSIRVNDYPHMRYLALQHKCITELPPFMVRKMIEEKRLVHILPEYDFPQYCVNLVFQSRHQLSRIARVYSNFCTSNAERYLQSNGQS